MDYIVNDGSTIEFMLPDSPSFRISKHYIFSLEETFKRFPNADKAIIVEEDLLVSPDFFRYVASVKFILSRFIKRKLKIFVKYPITSIIIIYE